AADPPQVVAQVRKAYAVAPHMPQEQPRSAVHMHLIPHLAHGPRRLVLAFFFGNLAAGARRIDRGKPPRTPTIEGAALIALYIQHLNDLALHPVVAEPFSLNQRVFLD